MMREENIHDRLLKLAKVMEEKKTPWYKKKLNQEDFLVFVGKNAKFYLKHKDWKPYVYVGSYDTLQECVDIIEAYCDAKPSQPINKKIKSVIITDCDNFLKKI